MSLPLGIDYTAPLADLPAGRASWRLDPDRAALLVHDLQRYFARPYADGCPAFAGAVAATARIIGKARQAGVPVFYTAQEGDQDPAARGLQGDLWGPGMKAVAEHTAILDAVAPADGDVVLAKHRYSAFARSDLAERMAAKDRTQLVITGVYAHIGVTATALEAFQRDLHPFVVADAVADLGEAEHRRALEQVASCSGVVLLADDVMNSFSEPVMGDARLASALSAILPAESVAEVFARPDTDWFTLGLDSLRAFDLLDRLADAGLDVDFGEFTRTPTLTWMREQAARATE